MGRGFDGVFQVLEFEPPRSEVLPKMAEALGVSVEELLIVGDEKPLKNKAAKRNRQARR